MHFKPLVDGIKFLSDSFVVLNLLYNSVNFLFSVLFDIFRNGFPQEEMIVLSLDL
jgi:hypothetical protein